MLRRRRPPVRPLSEDVVAALVEERAALQSTMLRAGMPVPGARGGCNPEGEDLDTLRHLLRIALETDPRPGPSPRAATNAIGCWLLVDPFDAGDGSIRYLVDPVYVWRSGTHVHHPCGELYVVLGRIAQSHGVEGL